MLAPLANRSKHDHVLNCRQERAADAEASQDPADVAERLYLKIASFESSRLKAPTALLNQWKDFRRRHGDTVTEYLMARLADTARSYQHVLRVTGDADHPLCLIVDRIRLREIERVGRLDCDSGILMPGKTS